MRALRAAILRTGSERSQDRHRVPDCQMSNYMPDMRVSHEDRDRVVAALRVAGGDGRHSAEELDTRLERALSARTLGELAVLCKGSPELAGGYVPDPHRLVLTAGGSQLPCSRRPRREHQFRPPRFHGAADRPVGTAGLRARVCRRGLSAGPGAVEMPERTLGRARRRRDCEVQGEVLARLDRDLSLVGAPVGTPRDHHV